MIFLRYADTFLQANTYILADDDERKALVVDTGAGCAEWVHESLRERELDLGAVLLTHGHLDHVWDVARVAGEAPVYIPEPDLYRLENPAEYLSPEFAPMLQQFGVGEWEKPVNVQVLPTDMYTSSVALVPGIPMRALPTPGHTEGSTVFLLEGTVTAGPNAAMPPTGKNELIMLSGDVLFNNGVGRTDLPGGDSEEMAASLRLLVQVIKPQTYVFPGHGPGTTMFYETRHSPYLHAAMS